MTPKTASHRTLNITDDKKPQVSTHAPAREHSENVQELLDTIARLEQEIKEKRFGGGVRIPGFKVSPKGGVSVYGIHANFPVTLYADQWMRVKQEMDRIVEFIDQNADLLDFRDDDVEILNLKEAKRREQGIVPRDPKTVRREYIVTAANERKAG